MNNLDAPNTNKRRTTFWWLFTISGSIAATGLAGLLLGFLLFPHSNLLGGFGLIFGPLWGLGATLLSLVTIGWLIARITSKINQRTKT